MKPTKVIFRKWKSNPCKGEVIALFPEIPAAAGTTNGVLCMAYEHIGQHGGANCHVVMDQTTPAKPAEYSDLLNELHKVGYRKLKVYHRFQRSNMQARIAYLANIH